jgi:hypothetical protein
MMEQVIEQNEDMRKRLAHLENAQSIVAPSVRFLEDDNSTIRTSTIRPTPASVAPPDSSSSRISTTFDPVQALREFETVLNASRVYRRAEPNETDMSFRSSVVRSHAWTALSGGSLADISVISVIALPLTSDEVKAMYRYLLPDTPAPQKGTLNRAISAITRTRRSPVSTQARELVPKAISLPDPKPWKITIVGAGGVGKTALATQVSECHRNVKWKLIYGKFCKSHFIEYYDPTIETAFQRYATVDGIACRLEVLDPEGKKNILPCMINGSETVTDLFSSIVSAAAILSTALPIFTKLSIEQKISDGRSEQKIGLNVRSY